MTGFTLLDGHDAIAWDFDGTLVDHPHSRLLHRYILATPHKRHVIVTFRSHGQQRTIWTELARYPNAPDRSLFDGVINMADEQYERCYDDAEKINGIIREWPDEFKQWKGEMCKQHGLSILVDDMTSCTLPGCEKHGVSYVHPDQLHP